MRFGAGLARKAHRGNHRFYRALSANKPCRRPDVSRRFGLGTHGRLKRRTSVRNRLRNVGTDLRLRRDRCLYVRRRDVRPLGSVLYLTQGSARIEREHGIQGTNRLIIV